MGEALLSDIGAGCVAGLPEIKMSAALTAGILFLVIHGSTAVSIDKMSFKDRADDIAKNHDYVLAFAKNNGSAVFNGFAAEEEHSPKDKRYKAFGASLSFFCLQKKQVRSKKHGRSRAF